MKTIYSLAMIVGFILLAATESESGASNLIGVAMFALSAYKLRMFDFQQEEHVKK